MDLDRELLLDFHLKSNKTNKMVLPENGSVVVIDDDPNQALPIVMAFSKKGIATTYYRGFKEDELPTNPIGVVRLAIVDLQLLSTDNDGHTIATRLIGILKRIISPDNGPYMLLIWSLKDHLFGEEFKKEINKQQHNLVPICQIVLEKSACLSKVDTGNTHEILDKVLSEIESCFEKSDLDTIKESILKNIVFEEKYEAKPDALKIIEDHLKDELKKAGVFNLFVIWENLVRKAGAQTVNIISSVIEYNDLWENNIRDVLKRMAQARIGQNIPKDDLYLKAALATFSGSFSEELEYEIRKTQIPDYINIESPFSIAVRLHGEVFKIILKLDERGSLKCTLFKNETIFRGLVNFNFVDIDRRISSLAGSDEKEVFIEISKIYKSIPFIINTKLHLELDPTESHMPGNIYRIDISKEIKKSLLTTYLNEMPDDVSDYHFVELEISPICDYAQKKWKKSRLLPGLLFPFSEKHKSAQSIYEKCPGLRIEGKDYSLVFNFLLFKSSDIDKVEKRGKPWFRIKRELLQDIISSLSGHVNRPGITYVG